MTQIISLKQAQAEGLTYYFTGKPCKRGHLAKRQVSSRGCVLCQKSSSRKYIDSEKGVETRRAYGQTDKCKAAKRAYARSEAGKAASLRAQEIDKQRRASGDAQFIAKRSAACAKWRAKNGARWNQYMRDLRADNPAMAVRNRLQVRLHHFLNQAGTAKTLRFQEYVGCTPDQAKTHLEAQFVDGMTWDNIGEWHIDHIRPCASFDLTDPEQQRECFHYTNLQPLWAEDNLRKSDKWVA